MPRSCKRRLEILEERTPRRPRRVTADELLAWLERIVAEGHPLARTEAFRAAWADHLAAREWLGATGEEPPQDYRPGDPEPVRRRMWLAWDHPELTDTVCRVLTVVADQAG